MYIRICRALVLSVVSAMCFNGCRRTGPGTPEAELPAVKSELDTTRQKLEQTEKKLAAQQQELDRAFAGAEMLKKQLADKDLLAAQKEQQLKAVQTQLADRRDAIVFAEISTNVQRGFASIALDRYRQFVLDYPKSPLVADATRAINELAVIVDRDSRARADLIDPKRRDRTALKNFEEGIATVDEISPLIRQRTVAEVVKLLGPPNRTYRNGTEIGYVDRIIDTTTGNKETLVIVFASERVVSLRVGYRGREIKL